MRLRSIIVWLLDIAPLAFVAVGCWCINREVIIPEAVLGLGSIGALALFPMWIRLRFTPLLLRLSARARREEIALTLLNAGEYLRPRLAIPLVRAIVPLLIVTLAALCGVFALTSGEDQYYSSAFWIAATIAIYLAVADLQLALARLCGRRRDSSMPSLILEQVARGLTMIVVVTFGIILLSESVLRLGSSPEIIGGTAKELAAVRLTPIPILGLIIPFLPWNRVCRGYFKLD